jgi:MFS family permease
MSRSNTSFTFFDNPLNLPIYLPSLLLAFCQGLMIPVLPLYARDLGASYGLIGLVVSAQGLGMLVSNIPSAILIRRLGQKRAMLLGIGVLALSTAALFWAQSVPEAILFRFIGGFGLSLYDLARFAYVADTVNVGRRGRSIALLGGIFRVGRFSGPMIGGVVGAMFGLRASFLLFGGACVAALIIAAIFLRTVETTPPDASTLKPHGGHLLATLRANYRILTTAGIGLLFASTIRAGRLVIIPLYAADVLGFDVQEIGLIESISAGLEMLLFYPTGMIMDQLGRKFAVVPCFTIQAVGMFLIPFTGGFVSLLLVTILIGIGNGLGSGAMMTLGADLAPPDSRAEFLGIWRLIGGSGATGGPFVVGSVADLLGLQAAAWVMAGIGLLAAAVFLFLVPETLSSPRRAIKLSWDRG